MSIKITQLRISNFRSIKNIDIKIGNTNVLIGQNNGGKSNLLRALNIAMGSSNVSSEDIHIEKGESLSNDKQAVIDILIRPIDKDGKINKEFSDFWISTFGEKWITTNETTGNYVGIRSVIQYDAVRNDYVVQKKPIIEWGDSIKNSKAPKKEAFGSDMIEYLNAFYMDAQRDIVEDLKSKKSFFGRATSQSELSEEVKNDIENKLSEINAQIISNIPSMKTTNEKLSTVGSTLGNLNSSVAIEPIARNISDLHKGMDIMYCDGETANFPVSQHGMGTRSWISFLTLGAYVDSYTKKIEADEAENYVLLTMEEPEAHLHPQAQRQLYLEIDSFNGQKMISTHSPSVLSHISLEDIIFIYKSNGSTEADKLELADLDTNKIKREVIKSNGELLFASGVVLCEGITEELALPIYFKEYFGNEATYYGISIIGIGGKNYKTFLSVLKQIHIPWFIFSDGEKDTIKTVKNAVGAQSEEELKSFKNVHIIDNQKFYESYLIEEGYSDTMIRAINNFEDDENYFQNYIDSRNHTKAKRQKTDDVCPTCNQNIYTDVERNYDGDSGIIQALLDCCEDNKAKYAECVAEAIVNIDDKNKKIPTKIKELFKSINDELHILKGDEKNETFR